MGRMIRSKDINKYPRKAICDICGNYIISYCGFYSDDYLLKKSFQHEDVKHVCKKCGDEINNIKNEIQDKLYDKYKNSSVNIAISAVRNKIDYMIYLKGNKNAN